MLVLVVLVLFRLGLRTGLAGGRPAPGTWMSLLITDASIVFTAALFTVRGLEMYLRARRMMPPPKLRLPGRAVACRNRAGPELPPQRP